MAYAVVAYARHPPSGRSAHGDGLDRYPCAEILKPFSDHARQVFIGDGNWLKS